MRETSLGLVPDLGGTQPLVEAVGYARALEICATGRWVGAEEAAATGLATVVVPREDLDAATADLVAALLAAPAAPYARPRRCCGTRARGRTTTSARPSAPRRPGGCATWQDGRRWTCH